MTTALLEARKGGLVGCEILHVTDSLTLQAVPSTSAVLLQGYGVDLTRRFVRVIVQIVVPFR